MSELYSQSDYEAGPHLAIPTLSRLLDAGALRLFLGAGVSAGFGLPGWRDLVARILRRDGDPDALAALGRLPAASLGRELDPVDDEGIAFARTVHEALYRDISDGLLGQLQRSPLLLAVAALMTGYRRGRIESIVTYNYDDLLEQYLQMLGYSVFRRTRPDQLSERSDVEINYVHGCLPQGFDGKGSVPEIILSEKAYRQRRAAIDEGWSAIVEHGLYSKIGLFIGLSADDSAILDIVQRAKRKISRNHDYNSYWLLTPGAFARNKSAVIGVGGCPIPMEKERLPQFVLDVCRAAAERSAR